MHLNRGIGALDLVTFSFFFFLTALFICFDFLCHAITGFPFILTDWSFFSVALFMPNDIGKTALIFIGLIIEEFVLNGSLKQSLLIMGLSTLWIIPLLTFLNKSLSAYPYIFLIISLFIYNTVKNAYWMSVPNLVFYTFLQIFVNILIVKIFLKYTSKGNLDNRL